MDLLQVSSTLAMNSLARNLPPYIPLANQIRDLAKLLVECKQDIPDCLQQYKPEIQPNAPLFDDDDDDDDEDFDTNPNTDKPAVPGVSKGAAWDAGDNSVVFQVDALRISSSFPFLTG